MTLIQLAPETDLSCQNVVSHVYADFFSERLLRQSDTEEAQVSRIRLYRAFNTAVTFDRFDHSPVARGNIVRSFE